jgi:TatD DNase family protein
VIFPSWPGTRGEGEALLRRGINAFFSFGSTVVKNHRKAMTSAALFPAERILLETDAPYQPLRGNAFSSWRDLDAICLGIANLRKEAGSSCSSFEELKEQISANFFRIFIH